MHVLIVGAGTGGLALAHSLRQSGIRVSVWERDPVPNADTGGYRVGISPGGSRALRACLPGELYELFAATCARPPARINMLTEQLRELLSFDIEGMGANGLDGEKSVIRKTLRRVLLSGLEDQVFFGKALSHYTHNADATVTAHFEDGSVATADVLVGADGTNSAVRRQRLPEARLENTGIVSFGGKLPMTPENEALLSRRMREGMSLVMAPRGFGGIVHSLRFDRDDAKFAARWPHFVNALDEDSIGWALWGARQNFPRDPAGLDGPALQEMGLALTRHWHPHLRELIRRSEPSTLLHVNVRTSGTLLPWRSSNVTLIGDAVHTMTPGRGAGANIALRDAALLGRLLAETHQGRRPLLDAIRAYEAEMLRYSSEAVQASKKQMDSRDLIHKPWTGALQLAAMRAAMRTIDAVPLLKRRVLAQMMRVRGEN